MDAVVYIGHGSRLVEGTQHFTEFINEVKKEVHIPVQEIAYLELTSPSIFETMEKVIKAGAKDILVVPVLLFAAAHFKRDVPEELASVQERFPEVNFYVSKPFDTHPKMVNLIGKRLEEKQLTGDGIVLLVGRGSSDAEPIQKLKEMSKSISLQKGLPVYTAFLTAGKPSFISELERLQTEYDKIYIVPYLLFTGMLLKRMERNIQSSKKKVILCNPLRHDPLMKEVLIERMNEVLMEKQSIS
ncbi:sirohydrochlorin chelatase [Bacillus sp. B1-b2]|uniref:sirohydrochlorin chelatase n=1 Tax=Bacillus sp. B1-b2 TaxID=2653201 RepID=UPI0012624676|nr:sirohydrochlorin chelatase [Bacillus sp. B1-b2]KAB7672596.1 sirohydrochlorin chelatase [Bacillus sp. B1-b2]